MEGIPKEYFDEHMSKLAGEIGTIKQTMATMKDLQQFEQNLKTYTDGKFEDLAGMVQRGFEEVYQRLDVREQLERHEHDIQDIKRALKLT